MALPLRTVSLACLLCALALCGCRTGAGGEVSREPAADEMVAEPEPKEPPPAGPEAPRPEFRQESPKSQNP